MKRRITVVLLVLLMVSVFPVTTQQPTVTDTAKFVLASWDFPDEHGQGIEAVWLYQNISGSWESLTAFDIPYTSSTEYEINDTATGIKILVKCYLNNTVVGADDFDDGKNYLQHSVSMTSINGTLVFSQQNFTYSAGTDALDPMFYYQYYVEMSFDVIEGEIYTAVVTYEIYHEQTESYYLNDGSSLSGIEIYSHAGLNEGEYGIGTDADTIESWIMPDDSGDENTIYRFNFTDIDNTNSEINVSIRYKIEATNSFYYFVAYNDSTYDTSVLGLSTSWTTLNVTCDNKFLDYIQFYVSDYPNSVASGNLSAWIDYIEIYRAYYDWQEVGEVTIILVVPIDPASLWALNGWYMLFGAVLVISSGGYAALKIRAKDYNSNLCFWPIVAFFIGWALILGVIS